MGFALTGAKADERTVLLDILHTDPTLTAQRPGQTMIGDKNYFGAEFETTLAQAGLTLLRPARKGEPERAASRFSSPCARPSNRSSTPIKVNSTSRPRRKTPTGVLVTFRCQLPEGKRRIEAEIPPVSGISRPRGPMVPSNKPDWWRKVWGELRAPHPELIRELRDRAGVQLYMLQPDRLLGHAKAALQVSVRKGSPESVARVSSSLAGQDNLPTGGWSAEAMGELLDRLHSEAPVQEAAIRYVATREGYISRDEVYALGEYDPERQLKCFTRPVKRIVQEFRDRGIIPEEAVDVLETEYDHVNLGWASGFTLTAELKPLLVS